MKAVRDSEPGATLVVEERELYGKTYTAAFTFLQDVGAETIAFAERAMKNSLDRVEHSLICFHNGHAITIEESYNLPMCLFCQQVFPE